MEARVGNRTLPTTSRETPGEARQRLVTRFGPGVPLRSIHNARGQGRVNQPQAQNLLLIYIYIQSPQFGHYSL